MSFCVKFRPCIEVFISVFNSFVLRVRLCIVVVQIQCTNCKLWMYRFCKIYDLSSYNNNKYHWKRVYICIYAVQWTLDRLWLYSFLVFFVYLVIIVVLSALFFLVVHWEFCCACAAFIGTIHSLYWSNLCLTCQPKNKKKTNLPKKRIR